MVTKIIDTNIVIRFINKESGFDFILNQPEQVCVSIITLGELLFGAECSNQKDRNMQTYLDFCVDVGIVAIDALVCKHYGEIKAQLRRSGTPIPDNDAWIAACAMRHNLKLISGDKHFGYIKGLNWEFLPKNKTN